MYKEKIYVKNDDHSSNAEKVSEYIATQRRR